MKLSKSLIVSIAIGSMIILFAFPKRDDQPTTNRVRDAIFQSTYLVDSDGIRDSAFCFGIGGGLERAQPCVYLVDFSSRSENSNLDYCYEVRYIAEANYSLYNRSPLLENRFYPFDQEYLSVDVCGKFEVAWGVKRPDGGRIEDWKFANETSISAYISADLKSKGYKIPV